MKILVRHNHLERLRKKCCTTEVKGLKKTISAGLQPMHVHIHIRYTNMYMQDAFTQAVYVHIPVKGTSTCFTVTYRMEDAALGAWWALVSSEASSGGSSERGSSGAQPRALQGDTTFEITYAVMQCSLIKNIFHFYWKGFETPSQIWDTIFHLKHCYLHPL